MPRRRPACCSTPAARTAPATGPTRLALARCSAPLAFYGSYLIGPGHFWLVVPAAGHRRRPHVRPVRPLLRLHPRVPAVGNAAGRVHRADQLLRRARRVRRQLPGRLARSTTGSIVGVVPPDGDLAWASRARSCCCSARRPRSPPTPPRRRPDVRIARIHHGGTAGPRGRRGRPARPARRPGRHPTRADPSRHHPCRSPGPGSSPRPTPGSCSGWPTTPAPRTACCRRRRSSSRPDSVIGPGEPIPVPDGIGPRRRRGRARRRHRHDRPAPHRGRRARRRARLHRRQRRHRPDLQQERPSVDRPRRARTAFTPLGPWIETDLDPVDVEIRRQPRRPCPAPAPRPAISHGTSSRSSCT